MSTHIVTWSDLMKRDRYPNTAPDAIGRCLGFIDNARVDRARDFYGRIYDGPIVKLTFAEILEGSKPLQKVAPNPSQPLEFKAANLTELLGIGITELRWHGMHITWVSVAKGTNVDTTCARKYPRISRAMDHVREFFPLADMVLFDSHGRWHYMDEDGEHLNFSDVKIDIGILEDASYDITRLPALFTADELAGQSDGYTKNIDLEKAAWEGIKQAAKESRWIPEAYTMNDWLNDVCAYLRRGHTVQRNTVSDMEAMPNDVAEKEGWSIFNGRDGLEIQRLDEAAKFPNDAAVAKTK